MNGDVDSDSTSTQKQNPKNHLIWVVTDENATLTEHTRRVRKRSERCGLVV